MTVIILGGVLLLIVLYSLFFETVGLSQQLIMPFIPLLLLGYSNAIEIRKDFENFKHFKIFGFTLFKSKLKIPFPDYIIVFSTSYKRCAEWGPVAAIGKERSEDDFVVRCFKDNAHYTVFRTDSLKSAKHKALELSHFLDVEIRGKN